MTNRAKTITFYRVEFKSRFCDKWNYFMQFRDEESAKNAMKGVRKSKPDAVLRIRSVDILESAISELFHSEDY